MNTLGKNSDEGEGTGIQVGNERTTIILNCKDNGGYNPEEVDGKVPLDKRNTGIEIREWTSRRIRETYFIWFKGMTL